MTHALQMLLHVYTPRFSKDLLQEIWCSGQHLLLHIGWKRSQLLRLHDLVSFAIYPCRLVRLVNVGIKVHIPREFQTDSLKKMMVMTPLHSCPIPTFCYYPVWMRPLAIYSIHMSHCAHFLCGALLKQS